MSTTAYLNLNTWDGLCPVLLPVGQKTPASIAMASVGIVVPSLLFLLALFDYIHRIWIQNHKCDQAGGGAASTPMMQVLNLGEWLGRGAQRAPREQGATSGALVAAYYQAPPTARGRAPRGFAAIPSRDAMDTGAFYGSASFTATS